MKRVFKVSIIFLLCISILTIVSNAESFKVKPDPEVKTVAPGETVEIKINITDIEDIEEGINTIVGYLDYEEELFSNIDFSGEDKWEVTYNDLENNELYGKFAIVSVQNGILQDTAVATLTLKLKTGLPDGETEIKFKSMVSSDGFSTIETEDKVVKLKIETPDGPGGKEEPKNETTPSTEKPANQENTKEKSQNVITGDKVFLFIGIIVAVIIIDVIIIIVMKKKNKKD